jgi:DNA modification methylase
MDNKKGKFNIHDRNELNDLKSKEWLISTRSVWKFSDYDFDEILAQHHRHLKKLILFFTKKGNVILNPYNDEKIKKIAESEERKVTDNVNNEIDFILLKEENSFTDYTSYKKVLSNELKKKYNNFYKILKEKKYLCVIVKDFHFKKRNSEMVMYHHDIARLLTQIGYRLQGITIWIPEAIQKSSKLSSAIQHEIILMFRKEPGTKSISEFTLSFPKIKELNENVIPYESYVVSIPPPRDKFKAQHPATFPEPDIINLIKNYTNVQNRPRVLDPFSGVGSTILACQALNVKGFGIELTEKWIELTKERFFLKGIAIGINKEIKKPPSKLSTSLTDYTSNKKKDKIPIQHLISGDANEKIQTFKDGFFDFIITSPPYWGILTKKIDHKMRKERVEKGLETKYTEENVDETFERDLANIESYEEFLGQLKSIFAGCFCKLKDSGYMVVIVSDFRHKSEFFLYHCDIALVLKEIGFKLVGLSILHQDNKNLYPYGYPYVFVSNIHHQFIIIVKKEVV